MQFICANYVNVKQLEWNKLYGALEAEVMPFMLIRIFFHVLCEWFMLMVDDYYLEEIVFVFCSNSHEIWVSERLKWLPKSLWHFLPHQMVHRNEHHVSFQAPTSSPGTYICLKLVFYAFEGDFTDNALMLRSFCSNEI